MYSSIPLQYFILLQASYLTHLQHVAAVTDQPPDQLAAERLHRHCALVAWCPWLAHEQHRLADSELFHDGRGSTYVAVI